MGFGSQHGLAIVHRIDLVACLQSGPWWALCSAGLRDCPPAGLPMCSMDQSASSVPHGPLLDTARQGQCLVHEFKEREKKMKAGKNVSTLYISFQNNVQVLIIFFLLHYLIIEWREVYEKASVSTGFKAHVLWQKWVSVVMKRGNFLTILYAN